jgi:hypothetical protein
MLKTSCVGFGSYDHRALVGSILFSSARRRDLVAQVTAGHTALDSRREFERPRPSERIPGSQGRQRTAVGRTHLTPPNPPNRRSHGAAGVAVEV